MIKKEEVSITYPSINDLLDPNWSAHPERLLTTSLDEIVLKSNALGLKTPMFTGALLEHYREGLVLDVGCGINFSTGSTLVDVLPNAYGIDPALEEVRKYAGIGIPPKDRVISGFAEDMPFKDKTFRRAVSLKCVGWYPNATVNPYWALNEMVRVTEDGGLVTIMIGQLFQNGQIILDAAQRVKNGPLGHRIAIIKDFVDAPSSQVAIRLRSN